MVPGEYEKPAFYDISNLNFVWETVKMDFANSQLQIQVNFTNAMYVSPETIQDEMVLRIRNPNLFKSLEFDTRIAFSSSMMVSTVKK